ncbi:MAG: CRTAC1 family protein [Planctomycetes bacterium]|nr:CRTAC1 family protein [Planctomycetota bacterium]
MNHSFALRTWPRATVGLCVGLLAPVLTPSVDAGSAFIEQAQFGNRTTLCVAWADFDGDGDFDLAVGNQDGNQLFINNGDGTFTATDQFGNFSTFAMAWGDFDNDGDPDLAVANGGSQHNFLFINNGDGTFTQQAQFGTGPAIALAWGDYDNDGDLDLAVGRGILGNNQQNFLYINNGDGTFTQQAQFGLLQTDSVVWGDFDNDGDLDLAVGNGGFGSIQQNFLYINNGNGTFTARAEFGTGDTASVEWGDFDNDGDLDLAVGNWQNSDSYLYINNGDGTFTQQLQFGLRDTNTVAWGDANNDGYLDLAVGNGNFTSADQSFLYVNDGMGSFAEIAAFGLGSTDGVAWADFDNDGDLDLAVGNEHSPSQNYLYINNLPPTNWLAFRLVGHFYDRGPGYSNRDGIGAKVKVYAPGHAGDVAYLLGYREMSAHGGFSSQSAPEAFFGLAGRSLVDVEITWPGSGGTHVGQVLPGVATSQRMTIHEAFRSPLPDPTGIDKARYISFQIPSSQMGETSLQVKLVSLMHPNPPNLPQFPAPDFSAQEGTVRYVGTPGDCQETESPPTTFKCALLQCAPVYIDWNAALGGATLHVSGQAVVPSSTYEVRQFALSCQGNEPTCTTISAPLTITTQRWGDVVSAFQAPSPAPLTQPNITDVSACVDKFKAVPTAAIVARADVNPAIPNGRVDIADVANVVDAFKNLAYPFPGPAGCP